MITTKDLRSIAKARLKDAEVLSDAKRYDGAVYLCGYAVEINLGSASPQDAVDMVSAARVLLSVL
jgi:hypothetical protein